MIWLINGSLFLKGKGGVVYVEEGILCTKDM